MPLAEGLQDTISEQAVGYGDAATADDAAARRARRATRFARAIGVLSMLVGCLVLLGWMVRRLVHQLGEPSGPDRQGHA